MTKPQPSIDHRLSDGTLTIRLLPGSLGERLLAKHLRRLRAEARAAKSKRAKR
jgi:hypothetical protein